MKRYVPVISALVAVLLLAPSASAAPREDSDYTEAYFPAGDGINTLHADILRPKGMPDTVKTPVILTVSPYTNHGGVPTINDPEDHVAGEGPSERFYDFLDPSRALERGYTYVIVDLPGFGGSSGCNDWGGIREQGAVKAAVEWAASRPWSNGRVGLLGKSYDAWTGLMGIAQQPEGLEAVAALEPVYSGYDYLYHNGVRFQNSVLTGALFQAFDAQPGPPLSSDPQYLANGAPQAWCYGVNEGLQQIDDPAHPFWVERNLLPQTLGETTPTFLTQGFLESNTKPNGAFDFWNGLEGTEHQAWFGQFNHCRAWETQSACSGSGDDQRLAVGREGFIDELMRFFDEHLKGIEPTVQDPTIAVQDQLARYREEESWPPADSRMYWSGLNTGAYTDNNGNRATGSATQTGNGVWTFSEPLPHRAWLSGEPTLKVRVSTTGPRANLVGLVYDVDPDGTARLISRGAYLLRGQGEQSATFDLYGQDWVLEPGHRIGVLVTGSDASWYNMLIPTQQTVTVKAARVALPFLTYDRTEFLDGGMTPELEGDLRQTAPVADHIAGSEGAFDLPPALTAQPDDDGDDDDDDGKKDKKNKKQKKSKAKGKKKGAKGKRGGRR